MTINAIADAAVLERYAPPGLLINDRLEIIQYRGNVNLYLDDNRASQHVLNQVRPELAGVLSAALVDMKTTDHRSRCLSARLDTSEVVMNVLPLSDGGKQAILILFHEPCQSMSRNASGRFAPHFQSVTCDLFAMTQALQTKLKELQATNEQLENLDEQLRSINEELETANEQLRRSQEDLHYSNEQLIVLNDELHRRMAELGASNDDLDGLLERLASPIVVVGGNMVVRRFSAAAARCFNLDCTAVGTWLADALPMRGIERLVAAVIEKGGGREKRLRLPDGNWHVMRVHAYRTASQGGRGAIIEFVRTTARNVKQPAATASGEI